MISDLDLLQAIKDEASEDFVVYGELGRDESAGVALLALERASSSLVVLLVSTTTGADGAIELGVDVRTELDAKVPDAGGTCPTCRAKLRPWARFCQNCGRDLLGQAGLADADPAELRAAVESAIGADFELLGEMKRREGGGRVYFARETATGNISALRLSKSQAAGEFELGETRVIEKSRMSDPAVLSVSVTQTVRMLAVDEEPAARPNLAKPVPAPVPARVSTALSVDARVSSLLSVQPPVSLAVPPQITPPSDLRAKRDWVTDGTAWAKNNWGPLAGVGVGAILAMLAWAALKN